MQALSGIYCKKRTEYRKKTKLHFPPLDLLFKEISALQVHVFDQIVDFNEFR